MGHLCSIGGKTGPPKSQTLEKRASTVIFCSSLLDGLRQNFGILPRCLAGSARISSPLFGGAFQPAGKLCGLLDRPQVRARFLSTIRERLRRFLPLFALGSEG